MKVLLATRNESKINKWGSLVKDLGYELITLNDLNKEFDEPKENGKSTIENALIKAQYYYRKTNMVTVTTDSSLFINGLSKEEQVGLFAGRKVKYDDSGNIVSEIKLSDEENYERFQKILNELGGKTDGYFEEGIIIYYGTNAYESKIFKMDRNFQLPGSQIHIPNAPMRTFTYYNDLNKYRSELTNEEANKVEGKIFDEQKEFINKSLDKADHIMEYNFEMLLNRILDSNSKITEKDLNEKLRNIRNSCICIGTGGSFGACVYASKILSLKNRFHNQKIITDYCEPRDFLLKETTDAYDNIFAVTYGNKNHGINLALEKARKEGLTSYVLTANNENNMLDNLIHYSLYYPKEYSFISLASTLTPMSLMLRYYLNNLNSEDIIYLIKSIFNETNNIKFFEEKDLFNKMKTLEIMSDYDSISATKVLESTIVESGLGFPIIHDKYGYFHGRSTMSFHHPENILIYLINGEETAVDYELISDLNKQSQYKKIIFLESCFKDKIIGDFDLTFKVLFLCKEIALNMNKSLSKVEYSPIVRKLYPYKGDLIQ